MNLTPAEKSARQVHLLKTKTSTFCGISFRRQRFFNKQTAFEQLADCDKCKAAHKDLQEAKAKAAKKK